jgi:hypothetical protein
MLSKLFKFLSPVSEKLATIENRKTHTLEIRYIGIQEPNVATTYKQEILSMYKEILFWYLYDESEDSKFECTTANFVYTVVLKRSSIYGMTLSEDLIGIDYETRYL